MMSILTPNDIGEMPVGQALVSGRFLGFFTTKTPRHQGNFFVSLCSVRLLRLGIRVWHLSA
jgi:hypothetical protein